MSSPDVFPAKTLSTTYYPDVYPAGAIKEQLRLAHEQRLPLDSPNVDVLLMGMGCAERELQRTADGRSQLERDHPGEYVWARGVEDIWTPYNVIGATVRHLRPTSKDVVYDLGAGYGRFLLYGAAVTEAQYKGIELLPERAAVAEAAAERLDLASVEVRQGNVLGQDYTDGTIFYMYFPFSERTFRSVMRELERVAASRQITVVGRSCAHILGHQQWLQYDGGVPGPYEGFGVGVWKSQA